MSLTIGQALIVGIPFLVGYLVAKAEDGKLKLKKRKLYNL